MAATAASDATNGPVMSLINKRLRALRKKYNRILQMEESLAGGKTLNKEQEEVLKSKPAVSALIDELEKLRTPLSNALEEELSLAIQHLQVSASSAPLPTAADPADKFDGQKDGEGEGEGGGNGEGEGEGEGGDEGVRQVVVEDLLNLLYFGSLFDVKSQSDFTSTMLTRTHERGCCLTYDYVTDDATDLLGERDLDMISMLGSLLISRPVNSSLSHKNALQRCIEHAQRWLANSDQPIDPNCDVTYAALRERLNKIRASDYFTTTPEIKAPVEVAAAAAAGNFAPLQVPVQVDYQQKDEESADAQGHDVGDNQSSPVEEVKDEQDAENPDEVAQVQQDVKPQSQVEHNQRDTESKEQQYIPRRTHQSQRGGRGAGGGRRGYPNNRGGRGSGSRGGGGYQNGRNQYYDQSGNYYPRNYYNNRGRGGRGGGYYNNHGSAVHGGQAANVGVAS